MKHSLLRFVVKCGAWTVEEFGCVSCSLVLCCVKEWCTILHIPKCCALLTREMAQDKRPKFSQVNAKWERLSRTAAAFNCKGLWHRFLWKGAMRLFYPLFRFMTVTFWQLHLMRLNAKKRPFMDHIFFALSSLWVRSLKFWKKSGCNNVESNFYLQNGTRPKIENTKTY